MRSPEIRLKVRGGETMLLELPDGGGGYTTVPVDPGRVRRMYDGLTGALPGIYVLFEDPPEGEMTADQCYATPVAMLSDRVPPEVLEALAGAAGRIQGGAPPPLLIAENDPFPWELVRPAPGSRMLGQIFDVARFDGACAEPEVRVSAILTIAPAPSATGIRCDVAQGTFAEQHEEVAGRFSGGTRELLDCRTATRADTLARLGSADRRVVHYMGHHFHDAVDPEESWLQLAGGEGLTPRVVREELGTWAGGPKWPWVFLNCCSGLKGVPFEDGERQWGTVLREAGAMATVGPYWRVEKTQSFLPAARFSQLVLEEGSTLGAAMRTIRMQPRPPTMLAYTLVGDPTAKVSVGE